MKDKLAYDIGAYCGNSKFVENSTDDILKYYNNVICIDANPNIIDNLKLKYKNNDNVKVIHGCISNSLEKETKFYISSNAPLSSIYKIYCEYYGECENEINVSNINVKDIIDKYGLPEYIKIDIEGADIFVLNQLSLCNELPRYISCELQWLDKDNNKDIDVEILNKLKDLGYNRFYIYDNVRKHINNKEYNKEWIDCINFENNSNYWISYEDTYNYIKSITININNWYDIFATKI